MRLRLLSQPILRGHCEWIAFSRIAGWVLGSPERSPSSLDVVIADAEWTPKSKADNHLINFKLLMQEAPNSYEKDEQQERGDYDSADYME